MRFSFEFAEDYLPLPRDLYLKAVALYVQKLMADRGELIPETDEIVERFRTEYDTAFEADKLTAGIASWAGEAARGIGKLRNAPSKVGIAREYVTLLSQASAESIKRQDITRMMTLVEWMHKTVRVPELEDVPAEIFE